MNIMKRIYIKPDCNEISLSDQLMVVILSNQQIGPDSPEPIGGEGDPDDEGDIKYRLDDENNGFKIQNSLW